MARSMSPNYDEAFRIVTLTGPADARRLGYYGPYATEAAAKGQITNLRHGHQLYARPSTFEAWIEKSSARWERVD